MTVKPRLIKIWGGAIEYEEPVPDTKAAAVKKAIDADLDAFEYHKEALLDHLRSPSKRGSKSEPFDEKNAWLRLTTLASHYFWVGTVGQEVLPPGERRRRLRAFERAVGKARAIAFEPMHDDVWNDLYAAWCETNVGFEGDDSEESFPVFFSADQFEKEVASLARLETAASHAAEDVPTGRPGRPAKLRQSYIRRLAHIYQKFTAREPGTGTGPFYRFVVEFRAAVESTDESDEGRMDESIVDAIKFALGRRRRRPKRRKQANQRRLIPYGGQFS